MATCMPWMTTAKAAQAIEQTFEAAVFADGFGRVMRAGRSKTALLPQVGTQQKLVKPDQTNE